MIKGSWFRDQAQVRAPGSSVKIGFYDISTGIQSKTTLESIPGWNLEVDTVTKEQIQIGDNLNFESGTNMLISYDIPSNTLKVDSKIVYEDLAFEFADIDGTSQQYTLDIKASFGYTIINTILETDDSVSGTVSGGASTITYTNVGTLTEIGTTSVVTTIEGLDDRTAGKTDKEVSLAAEKTSVAACKTDCEAA